LLLSCTKSRDFHNSDEAINDSISLLIDLYKSEGDIVEKKKILSKAVSFLNNISNDSIKNTYLAKFSYQYYKLGDTVNFLNVNERAMESSIKSDDSITLAILNWDLATYYRDKQLKNKEAYERYFKPKSIF
jgi:two-component system NarL family sensor kinase